MLMLLWGEGPQGWMIRTFRNVMDWQPGIVIESGGCLPTAGGTHVLQAGRYFLVSSGVKTEPRRTV